MIQKVMLTLSYFSIVIITVNEIFSRSHYLLQIKTTHTFVDPFKVFFFIIITGITHNSTGLVQKTVSEETLTMDAFLKQKDYHCGLQNGKFSKFAVSQSKVSSKQ